MNVHQIHEIEATLPIWRRNYIEPAPEMLELRPNGPVHRVCFPSGHEGWWVTGYDEVKAILSDPAFRPAGMPPEGFAPDSVILGSPGWLVSHEGARHARLRALISPAFSASRINTLTTQVRALVDRLLDGLAAEPRPADLHKSLSFPLPAMVICALLGIAYEDHSYFAGLSDEVMTHQHEKGARAESRQAWNELLTFIADNLARKRDHPGEDLMSDMLAAAGNGYEVTEEEMLGLLAGMLVAGHESTVAQIEFSLLALFRHPEQAAMLRNDPALAGQAVEEMLRMFPPGAAWDGIMRYPRHDVEIAGVSIPADSKVLVGLPATAFDPRYFPDPERFDITRPRNPHLAFSHGPHYCVGAALARLELTTVFSSIFQRFPGLRLAVPDNQLRLREDIITGGFQEFPVTW